MNLNTGSEDSFHELVVNYKEKCAELHIFYREINKELNSILWRIGVIKKKLYTEQTACDLVLRNFEIIEHNLEIVKRLMKDIPDRPKLTESYMVHLQVFKNNGKLSIISETLHLSIVITGIMFSIIRILILVHIDHVKQKYPLHIRGYIRRKELEKKVFGEVSNGKRLSANLSLVKKKLRREGLNDQAFIESMDSLVRINCSEAKLTEFKKDI